MTTSTVKIQVPMDKSLRDALAKRSKYLGFDSIQAFLRFLAKAEVDGRSVNFDSQEWPQPPQHVADRLHKELSEQIQLEKEGLSKSYHNVDDLIKDLNAKQTD
jgi:hypothetical protein